jgi:hypothetical protein
MHNLALSLDGMVAPTSHGTLGSRPTSSIATPGIADRMYWATDVDPDTLTDRANVNGQLYRDNGTGWDAVGPFASKIAMGTFNSPVATGNKDYLGLGFQPKLVEFVFTDNTVLGVGRTQGGEGAITALAQFSISNNHRLSSNDAYNDFTTAHAIRYYSTGGNRTFQADYVALLPDGFRLNWTDVSGPGTLTIVYKAFG